MIIQKALQSASQVLRGAGVPDPDIDASFLLANATGMSRMNLGLCGMQELTQEQEQRFSSLLFSRAARTPLQYLLGEQCFLGLSIKVDERVLIPRPETETLCETAIRFIRTLSSPAVLDLCTGSGAIAIALKHECPLARVTAVDISKDAICLAKSNADKNDMAIRLLSGDLFEPVLGERFDCIVSNPPYIASGECCLVQAEVRQEPLIALDGGTDGMDFYRRIAAEASSYLLPEGLLCLEIDESQSESVMCILAATKCYQQVSVHPDLSGAPRVVCAYALSAPT